MDLSVIIPVFNEEGSLTFLAEKLEKSLNPLSQDWEVIFVNDGSTDQTENLLNVLAEKQSRFKVIHFKRNFGQTAATMAGIDYATGHTIVVMDGDLQNDPSDIPALLGKIEQGYDVCSGWRVNRQDPRLTRIWPSRAANWLISRLTGVHLHDYGCSLKAYRQEILKDIRLYGEMHRFIPIYATWNGGLVTEVPVRHQMRSRGQSNYGMERVLKVILDLIFIIFMHYFGQKPMYAFGGFGLLSFTAALLAGTAALYYKFFGGKSLVETPLPLLSVFCFLSGLILIMMGLLAEMIMRTYHESQDKRAYKIKSSRNIKVDR